MVLAESFLGIILLGLLNIWLLLHSPYQSWSNMKHYRLVLVGLTLYVVGLAYAAWSTSSIPLTLNELFISGSAIIFLLFWLSSSHNYQLLHHAVTGLVLLSVALTATSFLFMILPNTQTMLPDMNLLVAVQGHNHLGALLLLVTPLTWHWAITGRHKSWYLLPLFLTVGLLTSLGRVVTSLAVLQASWIIISYRQHLQSKWLISWATGLLMFGLLLKISLSLLPACPSIPLADRLCKPIQQELRLYYWQQAWAAIQTKPLTGYGPGTFSLISDQYRQVIYMQTGYAHNAFLQVASESGLVTAMGLGIVVLSLLWSGRKWFRPKTDQLPAIETAVGIGVVTMVLNVMFDFDWSFTGIWLATLLLLVFWARPEKLERPVHHARSVWQFVYICLQSMSALLLGVYLITSLLVTSGKAESVITWFPYFKWHLPDFKSSALTREQLDRLETIYGHDSSWYEYRLTLSPDLVDRQSAIERGLALNPWLTIYLDPVTAHIDAGDWSAAEREWLAVDKFLTDKRDSFGFFKESIEFNRKEQLAQQAVNLGRQYLSRGDGQRAAMYWSRAHYYNEWGLAPYDPESLEYIQKLSQAEKQVFLSEILVIPPEFFGDNRAKLAQEYAQVTFSNPFLSPESSLYQQFRQRCRQLDEASASYWLGLSE